MTIKHPLKHAIATALIIAGLAISPAVATAAPHEGHDAITTVTDDGVTIYGDYYYADLDTTAPLILLFHQAGANGRGEYEAIVPWLTDNGFRVVTWDQRAGGAGFDGENRTVATLPAGTGTAYCDARPDLQAAHDYAIANDLAARVIVWGSSYSAALIFGLAADNPETVVGIASFSPATGGSMRDCRAQKWVEEIDAKIFVGRPKNEMARTSAIEQAAMFRGLGATFTVFDNGVHGSSMLDDRRTGHDMSDARAIVLKALQDMTD